MTSPLYSKIKDDLFGGLIELVKKNWTKLLPSALLYVFLLILVLGYPAYLYISKILPVFASIFDEARLGNQQDPEAIQEAMENVAFNELIIFQAAMSLFTVLVGTWFQFSWLKMGRDIVTKGDLQNGESYLSGHKMSSYLNAIGFTFAVTIVSTSLSMLINSVAPILAFPFAMVLLMLTMQLFLVVPYIFMEELSMVNSVRKSLATITPLIALKYAAFIVIGILAATIGFMIVASVVGLLLVIVSPVLAGIGLSLMTIIFFFMIQLTSILLPTTVYYHHTDISVKDYESSPYDSFG